MRRPWLSKLFPARRPVRRPSLKPDLVHLEDRSTPSTLELTGTTLTFTGTNVDNALTVSYDGTDLKYENALDPMTAIPAGFTDVNGDGTVVTGPIAGVSQCAFDLGDKTSDFQIGPFAADIGGTSFVATVAAGGTASAKFAAGGVGFVNTTNNNFSGFTTITIDNVIDVNQFIISSQSITSNQPVTGSGGIQFKGGVGGTTTINAPVSTNNFLANGSAISVNADISATGLITIFGSDETGPGNDVTVAAGVTIQAQGGNVAILAGDKLTIGAGALVETTKGGAKIQLSVDTATDPEGGTANTVGADLKAPGGITLTGNANDDSFTVSGTSSKLTVDGGGGTNTHTFNAQGTNPQITASTATAPGKAKTTFANPASFTLVNAAGQTVDGSPVDDTFVVQTVAGVPSYSVNGGAFVAILGTSIGFNGLEGNDKLFVDFTGGNPLPTGGITFDGGVDLDGGLAVIGSGTETVVYSPSATTKGNGVVTIDGGTITFQNLTPVDVTAVANFSLNLPGADDVVDVAADVDFLSGSGNPALRLTGTTGGVGFESVAVWSVTNLTLDTTAADGKDKITFTSANNLHEVTNVTVRTGGNTGDTVAVNGVSTFAGTVDMKTGGSLTVSKALSGGTGVTLATTDAAAAGQDITVTAAGSVTSGGGSVALSAGDNLTVSAGGQLNASTSLSLAVDANSADGGGGTANLNSAVLTGKSASLSGNTEADTFNLTGYSVALTLDGKSSGDGDTLNFNGSGVNVEVSNNTIRRTTGPNQFVNVVNVENLSVSNSVSASIGGTVSYDQSLKVNVGTTAISDGAILGTGAISFTNATAFTSGDVAFNATTFDVNGAALAINAGKTTTVTASGTATFNAAVIGPGSLTVNAAGLTTFAQDIGAGVKLASLSVGNPTGSTNFQGAQVLTTGGQTIADDVTVAAAKTTFQSDSGSIAFDAKLNGSAADANEVVVNAAKGVTFGGAVGGVARLTKLSSQTGTTVSGGLVNTLADQTYTGAVTYTVDGTQFTSAQGPVTFVGTLDANTNGDKNLTVNAGTGSVVLAAVGATGSPRNLTVSGKQITAGAAIKAAERADFTVGTGGMTQGAGAIQAKGIGLFGTGNFALGTTGNDAGASGLRIGLTANGAAATFFDVNDLSLDNSSTAAGFKTVNGNVTIKTGANFTAFDASGNGFAIPLINLGSGDFTVFPGIFGPAKVVFSVEIVANSATLGTTGAADANTAADAFSVRPSAVIPITVNGNTPIVTPGDALSVITSGTAITTFFQEPLNPSNGKYSFTTRQPINFTSIEQFGGFQAEGFVVQINDPATSNFRQFAVRYTLSSLGSEFTDTDIPKVKGTGTPTNTFIVTPQYRDQTGPYNPPVFAFGDVNGDGTPDLVFANGQDSPPIVTVIDGLTAFQPGGKTIDLSNLDPTVILAQFYAFEPTFYGGVSLAVGDLDGNGNAEIVVGAGVGGGPRVRIMGYTGGPSINSAVTTKADFFGYEPSFRGGVNVASGDTNGDGSADIILGTGYGGGPRVRVLDGVTYNTLQDYFAFNDAFRGGVYVGAGQFDNDGKADIVAGAGFGGGPRVRVIRGNSNNVTLADFFAFPPGNDATTGDSTFFYGVGGVAFGRLVPGSTSQQTILVASPRGRDAQALAFTYNPVTLTGITVALDLTLKPSYLPGGAGEIVPDVRTLRDAVSVAGFATSIL